MSTGQPGSPARQHSVRARHAAAGIVLVIATAVAGVVATPLSASASPTEIQGAVSVAGPVITSPHSTARGEPGNVDVLMLTVIGSLALVFGIPLTCRASIARRRLIRRFHAQLRNVDIVTVCRGHSRADNA